MILHRRRRGRAVPVQHFQAKSTCQDLILSHWKPFSTVEMPSPPSVASLGAALGSPGDMALSLGYGGWEVTWWQIECWLLPVLTPRSSRPPYTCQGTPVPRHPMRSCKGAHCASSHTVPVLQCPKHGVGSVEWERELLHCFSPVYMEHCWRDETP